PTASVARTAVTTHASGPRVSNSPPITSGTIKTINGTIEDAATVITPRTNVSASSAAVVTGSRNGRRAHIRVRCRRSLEGTTPSLTRTMGVTLATLPGPVPFLRVNGVRTENVS